MVMVWGGEVGGLGVFEEVIECFGCGYGLEGEDDGFMIGDVVERINS